MVDDAPRTLGCLIEGNLIPFTVKVTGDMFISKLKDLIKAQAFFPAMFQAKDLIMWKVRTRMSMASNCTT